MSHADEWLHEYNKNFPSYEEAARQVEEQIVGSLQGQPLGIHSITARPKDPDSLAEKVRIKDYDNPASQVTDLLGVRVVTLTEATVDSVAKRITSMFAIDSKNSVDKTAELGNMKVGYRSRHLILRPLRGGMGDTKEILRSTCVEVQVRSILSHAWAELEHSLRYKFGESLRDDLSRRFTLVAGTLELVDREFAAIEQEIRHEVEIMSVQIQADEHGASELTTMSLLACLASDRPEAAILGPSKLKLQYEDAFRMRELLVRVGVRTVGNLRSALAQNEVLEVLRGFAERSDGDPDKCSAIVVIGAVVGVYNRDIFDTVRAFNDDRLVDAVCELKRTY